MSGLPVGTLRSALTRQLPWMVGVLGLAAAALAARSVQMHINESAPGHAWESLLVFALGSMVAVLVAVLLQQQRRAHERAEREARRLSTGFEHMALAARETFDAVVITDTERRITWVNAGFERITGWRAAEVLGRRPGELLQVPQTDPDTVARMRAALDAGQSFNGELINRHRDGKLYWTELGIHPLFDGLGTSTGFLAVQRDVTAAREAAQVLAAERKRLQRIIEATQAGTWEHDLISGEDRVSPRYAGMLGYTLEEWRAPGPRAFLDLVHPDDVPGVAQAQNAHLHGLTREYRAEFRMRHKAGHWVWLGSYGLVVERDARGEPLAMAGIHLDITERRHAQAEQQRSAEVLRSAIDAIDEVFVLYDADDRLVLCNEKYREVYAHSADQIRPGVRFEDLLRHGLKNGQFAAAIGREEAWLAERMAQHRSGTATIVQRLDDGRTVRIVERCTPDGSLVGFRVDITELARATETAERAVRAKSEFIATISHELRTPLQSIIGFSELGRHFAAGHVQFETMFDDIHAGGHRMLTLVNALLDISKLDASSDFATAPGDLAALAAAVVHELSPQLAARQLTVRWPAHSVVLPVRVNAFRMQQVLRNVLANAVRFAREDSCIEIEMGSDASVVANGQAEAPEVWLSVRDHGVGIPDDELQSVFEPFVQSSRTRDGSGGTGLGLAICRRIMQAHGGRIEASHAEGGGAVLTLRMPAAPTSVAMPSPNPHSPPPSPSPLLTGERPCLTPSLPSKTSLTSVA